MMSPQAKQIHCPWSMSCLNVLHVLSFAFGMVPCTLILETSCGSLPSSINQSDTQMPGRELIRPSHTLWNKRQPQTQITVDSAYITNTQNKRHQKSLPAFAIGSVEERPGSQMFNIASCGCVPLLSQAVARAALPTALFDYSQV